MHGIGIMLVKEQLASRSRLGLISSGLRAKAELLWYGRCRDSRVGPSGNICKSA
jgi:hypothetical protein